jgi:hypothetical protein
MKIKPRQPGCAEIEHVEAKARERGPWRIGKKTSAGATTARAPVVSPQIRSE